MEANSGVEVDRDGVEVDSGVETDRDGVEADSGVEVDRGPEADSACLAGRQSLSCSLSLALPLLLCLSCSLFLVAPSFSLVARWWWELRDGPPVDESRQSCPFLHLFAPPVCFSGGVGR